MNFASLGHSSLFERLGLLVSALPLVVAIWCAIRPSEQRLALMRPLSLAGIFASVANLLLGLANAFFATASAADPARAANYPHWAVLFAEAMIPGFVGFACLTVAWLCVAVAIRKSG